jgi:hypothetical protein
VEGPRGPDLDPAAGLVRAALDPAVLLQATLGHEDQRALPGGLGEVLRPAAPELDRDEVGARILPVRPLPAVGPDRVYRAGVIAAFLGLEIAARNFIGSLQCGQRSGFSKYVRAISFAQKRRLSLMNAEGRSRRARRIVVEAAPKLWRSSDGGWGNLSAWFKLPGSRVTRRESIASGRPRRPSGAEEEEAACGGRCGGASASPAKKEGVVRNRVLPGLEPRRFVRQPGSRMTGNYTASAT